MHKNKVIKKEEIIIHFGRWKVDAKVELMI